MKSEFIKCDSCSDKLDSPILCAGCLHNRGLIERLHDTIKQAGPHKTWRPLMAVDKFEEGDKFRGPSGIAHYYYEVPLCLEVMVSEGWEILR